MECLKEDMFRLPVIKRMNNEVTCDRDKLKNKTGAEPIPNNWYRKDDDDYETSA